MKTKQQTSTILLLVISLLVLLPTLGLSSASATDRGIPILTYHHILFDRENLSPEENSAIITPEAFSQQMYILAKYGFTPISLEQFENYLNGSDDLPPKPVVITFDDGYLSNFRYAYPILKKYNFTATIFVITSRMTRTPEPFDPRGNTKISWAELPQYDDVFDYHGHTHDLHDRVGSKSTLVLADREVVAEDLGICRQLLNTPYLAYPYGQYDLEAIETMQSLGYRLAFVGTDRRARRTSDPFRIPRYSISPETTSKDFMEILGIDTEGLSFQE